MTFELYLCGVSLIKLLFGTLFLLRVVKPV